jgi:hypothetical protein
MSYWPFKDMHVSDRFADGLIKAGLPGEHEGYYRISTENRLAEDAIRDLLFGREVEGRTQTGGEWSVKLTRDGKATAEFWSSASHWSETGSSWIEGKMICNDFPFHWAEGGYCASIFRNPHGNSKMKNEYLMLTSFGFYQFSPVE